MPIVTNNFHIFKISTNSLEPKENMIEERAGHGLQKMAPKIFAFGGFDRSIDIKSAEVHDIYKCVIAFHKTPGRIY